MALPTSGNLSIKYAAGVTRSIACVVDGNFAGNKSLSTLSETAGKFAPHCMREFYGYVPLICSCFNTGSVNVETNTSTCYIAWVTLPRNGQCSNTTIRQCFCIQGCVTSGFGCMQVSWSCNGSPWCTTLGMMCVGPAPMFIDSSFTSPVMDCNDTFCVRMGQFGSAGVNNLTVSFNNPAGAVVSGTDQQFVVCSPSSFAHQL